MRVGSGRPRKNQTEAWLAGASAARRVGKEAPAKAVRVVVPPAPMRLTEPVKGVWEHLAPFAAAALTLTPATALDFEELCHLVCEMRDCRMARQAAGWNDDGLKFAAPYRGLVQRVEAKMRAFKLAPIGKEMAPTDAKPDDPFAEFDAGGPVQ